MSHDSTGSNATQNPDTSAVHASPELVAAADEAVDAMGEIIDREPATSRRGRTDDTPDPQSALAVRLTDGQLFLSLQDVPPGTDLSGRTIVSFLVLSDAETLFVKAAVVDGHDDLVARLVGGLPRTG